MIKQVGLALISLSALAACSDRANEQAAVRDDAFESQFGAAKVGSDPSVSRDELQHAQRQLQSLGFDPGKTDGILSKETRAALRRFQKDQDLEVSGRLDIDTRNRLSQQAGRAE